MLNKKIETYNMSNLNYFKEQDSIPEILNLNRVLSYQLLSVRNLLKKTIDKNQVVLVIQRVFKKWIQFRKYHIIIIQKFIRKKSQINLYRQKIISIYIIQLFFRKHLLNLFRRRYQPICIIQKCVRRHLKETTSRERDLLIDNFKLKRQTKNLTNYNQQLIQQLKNNKSYIENEFECPITMKKISESRDLKLSKIDGRFYERYSICKWLRNNPVSPLTREPMSISDLVPVNWLYSILDNSKLSLKCPPWKLRVVDFMFFKNICSPWFKIPYINEPKCQTNICIIINDKGVGLRFSDYMRYYLENKGYLQLSIYLLIRQTKIKIHSQSWLKRKFSYLRDVNYYFSTRELLLEENQVLSDLFWILNKRVLSKNLDSELLFELSFCQLE